MSLILFVRKYDEELKFCIDYQKLNIISKKNQYLLFLINEILQYLSNAKIFIKIDICQIFYYIWIHLNSENLIIFQIRYNLYKYKMLLFNLINNSATFQHYMNNLFLDCFNDFLTIFLNDILIYFKNKLEHQVQMIKILKWLQKTDFQTDVKKDKFNIRKTKYLKFMIKIDEIEVNSDKIIMIENWQAFFTVKKIQFFLEFCNFYCQFI